MTLLSPFTTSTGIFCFVPISQRLIESGIVPPLNDGRLWRLPVPMPYNQNSGRPQFLCKSRSEIPLYDAEETFVVDQQPETPCANNWSPVIVSPLLQSSPANSLASSLPGPTMGAFYGRDFTSCASVGVPSVPTAADMFRPGHMHAQDSALCDSCSTLLRRELDIPPDHIPSVLRALALFEAQDRLCDGIDVGVDACEVAALTDAFSMLRL